MSEEYVEILDWWT